MNDMTARARDALIAMREETSDRSEEIAVLELLGAPNMVSFATLLRLLHEAMERGRLEASVEVGVAARHLATVESRE